MIKAENISKQFNGLEVLKNVSLEIKKSEIVAIVGSSGAGKTTLLQILGVLDSPEKKNAAKLSINGIDVLSLKDKQLAAFRNKNLGFIFQFHRLLPEFTAIENVCIPAFILGKTKNEAEKEAKKMANTNSQEYREYEKVVSLNPGFEVQVKTQKTYDRENYKGKKPLKKINNGN